ncbi:MAG: outer membrane lipoprotein carrier protein LolA [Peptococcaceae bacterium]|nr:MAG: outer membrane lipoprotein carrier protein LolA [Peptococcaceae bacterium]
MVFLAVILSLALAGCGGSGPPSAGPQAEKQPTAQEKTGQPGKEGSVADLFAKGQTTSGMSYEYILTTASGVMKGKVWLQGNKIKTDATVAGKQMISFFDGDSNTIVTYYPDQNKAVKLSADKQPKTVLTPGEYTGGVDLNKAKVLETVDYDGVRCRVVAVSGAGSGEEVRMWVREDYGLPIRVEVASAAGGKTVMEYKNLQVGSLPPDTFKLPAGVEVTDINKMMEQLPTLPVGPGKQP